MYMGDYKWLRKRKENRKSSKGYKEEIKTTNNHKKNVQPHSHKEIKVIWHLSTHIRLIKVKKYNNTKCW